MQALMCKCGRCPVQNPKNWIISSRKKKAPFFIRLTHEHQNILEGLQQEINDEAIEIVTRLLSQDEEESKTLTQKAVEEISQVIE